MDISIDSAGAAIESIGEPVTSAKQLAVLMSQCVQRVLDFDRYRDLPKDPHCIQVEMSTEDFDTLHWLSAELRVRLNELKFFMDGALLEEAAVLRGADTRGARRKRSVKNIDA
jgi:hypothetical protein